MKNGSPNTKAIIRKGKKFSPSGLDDGTQKKNKIYAQI